MMSMLNQMMAATQITPTNSNEPIGNYRLTFSEILGKVGNILLDTNPTTVVDYDAARILYVANNIQVRDHKFAVYRVGNLYAYVVQDNLGKNMDQYPVDIAEIGDRLIVFVFRNALVNPKIDIATRVANLYMTFQTFVSLYHKPQVYTMRYTIYSYIIDYAPYVLTIKAYQNILHKTITIDMFSQVVTDDMRHINEDSLGVALQLPEKDLLVYGALAEFM